MEAVVLAVVMSAFIVYLFVTSDGDIPLPYAPRTPQLGIDPGVQIAEVARKLGVRASTFDANVWSFEYKGGGLTSGVSVHLAQGPSDDVRTWFVYRLVLHNHSSLPGDLAIGTRGPRSDEEPIDMPLPTGFQDAYWFEGTGAEILAICDATLCEVLLDAHRVAPRWTRVLLGQSAVFERMTHADSTFGELEGLLPALLERAHVCVRAVPKTRDLAALLRRRVGSDDEPLTMRWRAAHVLLTQMPQTRPARELAASLGDLPDALRHVCSVWRGEREGDPREDEPALVAALTGALVDDGAPLYLALSEAGWDASGSARVELMRRGSAALGDILRGEGGVEGGQITLAEEPAGGLSEVADGGELASADE